ncbi:hypothetical protein LXL04_030073 [Taraxacum kok-saghyz]
MRSIYYHIVLLLTIVFLALDLGESLHPHHFTYQVKGGKYGESQSHKHPKEGKDVELGMDLYPTGSSIPDCSHACGPCFPCRRTVRTESDIKDSYQTPRTPDRVRHQRQKNESAIFIPEPSLRQNVGPSPWSAIKRTDSGPSPWSESESVLPLTVLSRSLYHLMCSSSAISDERSSATPATRGVYFG